MKRVIIGAAITVALGLVQAGGFSAQRVEDMASQCGAIGQLAKVAYVEKTQYGKSARDYSLMRHPLWNVYLWAWAYATSEAVSEEDAFRKGAAKCLDNYEPAMRAQRFGQQLTWDELR